MLRRTLVIGALAGTLATMSCLFSTTAPKRNTTSEPPPDPDTVVITGVVTHFDPHTHARRNMPGRYVNVDFFVSVTQNGTPTLLRSWSTVVSSRGAGVYEVQYKNHNVVAAEVKALVCEVSPEDPPSECCDIGSTCPEQCRIWTAAQHFVVSPGQRFQRNITVTCVNGIP